MKQACRFLLGAARCIWRFERQDRLTHVAAFSDSDWAGCVRTRRSTSCTHWYHGKRLVGSSSTTQTVISLSSGEAEFYGLVKATSRVLGLHGPAADFGRTLAAAVYLDSTPCKGVASRCGVGRIRHPHFQVLWVQAAVAEKVTIYQVAGSANLAGLGTKHLPARDLAKCLELAGLRLARGQSAIALQAAV